MNAERSTPKELLIGEWTATPSRNLLTCGDRFVRLEPRAMDLLMQLAARPGELVSKEDLIQRIWEGRHVTDDVLTVTIYSLRKALGDEARRPRYIETISRRGYRLIAPVQSVPSVAPAVHPLRAPWVMLAAVTCALIGLSVLSMLTLRDNPHVLTGEALEAYLKGRYLLDQRSSEASRQALEHFTHAVGLEPNSPAAHAGLADTYTAMSDFGLASPLEMRPRAMQSARHALELNAHSPEGLAALGRAQFLFDWDFDRAARSLTRAVAIGADYMPAHQALSWLEAARGRHGEASSAARRALQLDPVNTARYTELAWILALGGRHHEALVEIDQALQLNPRSSQTHMMKAWVRELAGEPDAAFASLRDAARFNGASAQALHTLDSVYQSEGLAGCYRNWLKQSETSLMSATLRAQLYARIGEIERAIESIERAFQVRESALAWINVEPRFEPLRSHRRFQLIASRVGTSQ